MDFMNLDFLLNNELFRVAPLLRTKDFIDLCKKAGINISKETLEYYEKHKIFFPIARARMPWKSRWAKNGATYVFNFDPDQARNWYSNNILWEPNNRKFINWKLFTDDKGETKYENYYSRFQIFHLYMIKSNFSVHLGCQYLLSSEFNPLKYFRNEKKLAKQLLVVKRKSFNRFSKLSFLCQCISNRYFPHTQSDMRTITIRMATDDWNWYEYRKLFNPADFGNKLGISCEDIKSLHGQLSSQASHIDPLEDWHDLVIFTKLDKRSKLKGDAFLAQQFYAMELMLRMFFKDAYNEQLPAPYFHNLFDIPYNNNIKNEKDALHYLEYTINRYNLNPQPKIIIICEGETEEEQYPRIINEIFGYDIDALGIKVLNLKGVGQAVGNKIDDKYTALRRFIDYNHHRLTLVFLILDNEDKASKTIERLISSKSIHDKERYVTNQEYTFLWNPCFEFQNFNDQEIANSLNKISETIRFTKEMVENKRKVCITGKRHDTLSDLFKENTGKDLCKTLLANYLFEELKDRTKNIENPWKSERIVFKVFRSIINIASWHNLPNSLEERNNFHNYWFGSDKQNRIDRFIDHAKQEKAAAEEK